MWCGNCHYGSDTFQAQRCPRCGGNVDLVKCPFPPIPKGMGSGGNKSYKDKERVIAKVNVVNGQVTDVTEP